MLSVIDFATSVDVPVLMGDFNHGPAAPGGITWDYPFYYGLMTARGFYSPYVLRDGRCTWCLENAQAASFLPFNYIIDHIYITTNTMDRVRSVEVHGVLCVIVWHRGRCTILLRHIIMHVDSGVVVKILLDLQATWMGRFSGQILLMHK